MEQADVIARAIARVEPDVERNCDGLNALRST